MVCYKCELCQEDYDVSSRLPRVLLCGHTLCQICVSTTISSGSNTCDDKDMSCSAGSIKCPFCEGLTADSKLPINHFILDAIKPKNTGQTDDKALNIILDILDSNGVSEKSLNISNLSLGAEKPHKLPLKDKQMKENRKKSPNLHEETDAVKAMKTKSRHLGKLGHKMMEQNMDLCEVLRRHEKLLNDLEEEQRKLVTATEQGTQLMQQLKSTEEELSGLEETEQIIKSCRLAKRCCNAVDQWNFRVGDCLEKGTHKSCHEMRLKMDITLHAWEYSRVLSAKMKKLRSLSQLRSSIGSSVKHENGTIKSNSNGEPTLDHETSKAETGYELTPLLNIFMYTISALEGGVQRVFGACRNEEQVFSASLFLYNDLLHLHYLEENTKTKGLVFDYEHLLSLADPQDPTMFLELSWGEKKQGNVYIVAENRESNHLLQYVTGRYLMDKNIDNVIGNKVDEVFEEDTENGKKNDVIDKLVEKSVTSSDDFKEVCPTKSVDDNVIFELNEKKGGETSVEEESNNHYQQLLLICKKNKNIKFFIEIDKQSLKSQKQTS
ncbi:unnamed protein product, partial [Meganyctiphanes norvegica]